VRELRVYRYSIWISDDGNILGRNTGSVLFGVVVEWTPAVQDKRVVWSCKVTFPGRFFGA